MSSSLRGFGILGFGVVALCLAGCKSDKGNDNGHPNGTDGAVVGDAAKDSADAKSADDVAIGATDGSATGDARSTVDAAPLLPCHPAAINPGAPKKAFPQHVGYPGCPDCAHPTVAQTAMDADIKASYDVWKNSRIKAYPPGGAVAGECYIRAGASGLVNGYKAVTQSEGHGYAMLILALMAGHDPEAKALFDSFNRVRKAFPSSASDKLMSWALPGTGDTSVPSQPPATDGDMDEAYALLLAYDQWGDEANNHYLAEAKTIIGAMEEKFITKGTGMYFPRLNIGDPAHLDSAAPESLKAMTRPSDFMVDHMRAYKNATGHTVWSDVETGSLNILKQVRNATTGLVPDFVAGDPPVGSVTGTADEGVCYNCYDYNSCRVPWRQAVAVAHYGVAGSRDIADKMVTWVRATFKDDPTAVTGGFNLDGTSLDSGDSAFTSPFVAAGITNVAHQAWLDKGWAYMKAVDTTKYYGGSITLMSMLLVSGNWWVPSGGAGSVATPDGGAADH